MTPRKLPGNTAGSPVVSASPAHRACCCPAEAVVRIVLPPSPTRPQTTDLLLCAHHYRMSHNALIAAEAAICELPGIPGDLAEPIGSAARHVPKTAPLDTRDRRYWPYVIVTCALPAAAIFAVVMWRPEWAWWALAAELAAITVLTAAWRILRAVKLGRPASVTSAEEQERRDAGMSMNGLVDGWVPGTGNRQESRDSAGFPPARIGSGWRWRW